MEIYFVETGRRRLGEYADCKQCGNQFVRRINSSNHAKCKVFCSSECASKDRQSRITVKCFQCGKEIERRLSSYESSKNKIFFCGRECKDFAQSLEGGCKEIQPSHYGSEANYRYICREELKQGCVGCPVKELYKLTVHHKDGDRSNNVKSNLEVVCWNCHAKRHLKLVGQEWCYCPTVLTPREMLSKIA